MCNLASLLVSLGAQEQAEKLLRESLALSETHADWHPYQWVIQSNLATVLTQQGKMEDAAILLERLIVEQQEVFGPNHPQVLLAQSSLANLRISQGQLEPASQVLDALMQAIDGELSEQHPL